MLTCQDLASMMSIWCLAIMLNRIRETFKDVYTCWACVYIYIYIFIYLFNNHMFIVVIYTCAVSYVVSLYTRVCVCVCVRFDPCCTQCSDGSDAN